ncbi:MAG: ABC transporter ATP-binding protein [Planctomycetales bacterium]|nr:ABC transporter ATP-binding protein [Planctomycetales bacterium]
MVSRVILRTSTLADIPLLDAARAKLADAFASTSGDVCDLLVNGAQLVGLTLREAALTSREVKDLLAERMLALAIAPNQGCWLFESQSGGRIDGTHFHNQVEQVSLTAVEVEKLLTAEDVRTFVVCKDLACQAVSNHWAQSASNTDFPHSDRSGHEHSGHENVGPLRRFFALLRLEQRDIFTVLIFALANGVLALATPLAVESLVNVVSWGTHLQPLIILALILLVCLAVGGVLQLLQTVVVEIMQRRQFVRFVSDLSHRFPRASVGYLENEYRRELANRVFDIVTIQKSMASLLLEGISIVLATTLGMTLLAFYHPFLLGFDLVLLFSMLVVTRLLGRGGVRTSIQESKVKYQVAHWLQDVLASPKAFKLHGGEPLAIENANRLTTNYLRARQQQFRIVMRQFAFAIGLQALASTAILSLGGWLVINQQLTLGQLVASELVVTVVVGAFSKAGKTIEKFYDLMAAVDKVGHLVDIPVDERTVLAECAESAADIRWSDLEIDNSFGIAFKFHAGTIQAGEHVALTGSEPQELSAIINAFAGLTHPKAGEIRLNGIDVYKVARANANWIGLADFPEIINASLATNVGLGRFHVGTSRLHWALKQVAFEETVQQMPAGIATILQSDGKPLCPTHLAQLSLARAIADKPKLLIIDGLLDWLPPSKRQAVWSNLTNSEHEWTIVLRSNCSDLANQCGRQLNIS